MPPAPLDLQLSDFLALVRTEVRAEMQQVHQANAPSPVAAPTVNAPLLVTGPPGQSPSTQGVVLYLILHAVIIIG